MNWLHIVCAAAAFWVLGFLWYSVLFGKMWATGLEQRGLKMERAGMGPKMVGSFLANLVAAVVMQRLLSRIGTVDAIHGLRTGIGVGLGFSATAITIGYIWQSQPFRVWLIDVAHYTLGAGLLGLILSAWH
ncbi:MAG TPA: DUF1761 domain-containing protein [Chthoniobacterales bacterium]|nr:DUF1761 domain-containing protein [Chthoniobacterales bacterium]